ncbi:MAG: PD40 domain-containing protein [Planctomycetes bacterium]|nr:PD40 domain-containing protein [Planctomycetota bacterium]
MPLRRRRARTRLSILAALALIFAVFACRPAWSPDGRKLLFPTVVGNARLAVGLFDREAATASVLLPPAEGTKFLAMTWTGDGATAVILTGGNDKSFSVTMQSIAAPGHAPVPARTIPVVLDSDDPEPFIIPPTIVGTSLFLSSGGIVRVDLGNGTVKRRAAADGRSLIVTSRGDGLCYLSMGKGADKTDWQLGSVDPTTLELEPLFSAPTEPKWAVTPLPAFTADLRRTALHAKKADGDEQAILIFADGELEAVLPLGPEREVGFHSVAWTSDGVTLLVSLCRRRPGQPYEWILHETTFSGSVSRDTVVFSAPGTDRQQRDNETPFLIFPMALSPDGKVAAFSTAMIEGLADDVRGLYLVALDSKQRTVRRLPFPAEQ